MERIWMCSACKHIKAGGPVEKHCSFYMIDIGWVETKYREEVHAEPLPTDEDWMPVTKA